MPPSFALLPTMMVFLVPGPWHKTFVTLCGVLNLWAIWRYFEERSRRRLFLCGLMVGLSAALRHDVAGFAVLSFLITLLAGRTRFAAGEAQASTLRAVLLGLSTYILAALLAFLPFALPYIPNLAVGELFYGLLGRAGRTFSKRTALRFPNPLLVLDPTIGLSERFNTLVIYTPPLVSFLALLLLIWRIRRRTEERSPRNLFILSALLLVLFNYNQVVIGTSALRILQGGALTYLVMGYLMFESYISFTHLLSLNVPPSAFRQLLRGGAIVLLLLFPTYFVGSHLWSASHLAGTIGLRRGKHVLLGGQRGGIYVRPRVGPPINALVQFVQLSISPEESVWVTFPFDDAIYFLSGRGRPPSISMTLGYGPGKRLSMVRESPPDWILVGKSDLFKLSLSRRSRGTFEYILDNYHYEQQISSYLALRWGAEEASFHLLRGIATLARQRSHDSPRDESVLLGAVADLEAAVRGGIRDEYTLSWLSGAYAGLADTYKAADALDDAIAHYQQAITLVPEVATYHYALADAYLASGRAQEAVEEYERALVLDSNLEEKAWIHLRLGEAYRQSGRREEAIREYERVLELKPDNVTAQRALAALGQ
jgi:tetratricopeptide (TPR) repeat protein